MRNQQQLDGVNAVWTERHADGLRHRARIRLGADLRTELRRRDSARSADRSRRRCQLQNEALAPPRPARQRLVVAVEFEQPR